MKLITSRIQSHNHHLAIHDPIQKPYFHLLPTNSIFIPKESLHAIESIPILEFKIKVIKLPRLDGQSPSSFLLPSNRLHPSFVLDFSYLTPNYPTPFY